MKIIKKLLFDRKYDDFYGGRSYLIFNKQRLINIILFLLIGVLYLLYFIC